MIVRGTLRVPFFIIFYLVIYFYRFCFFLDIFYIFK